MYQSKVKLSLTFTQRLGYLIKLVTVKWSNEHSEANEGKHYLNGLNQYVLTIKKNRSLHKSMATSSSDHDSYIDTAMLVKLNLMQNF